MHNLGPKPNAGLKGQVAFPNSTSAVDVLVDFFVVPEAGLQTVATVFARCAALAFSNQSAGIETIG